MIRVPACFKTIFFILLALESSFVFAEWEAVSMSVNSSTLYVDMSTLKKINGYYEVWTLLDMQKPMEGSLLTNFTPIQSYKERLRISCSEDKMKTLKILDYQEHMGGGAILNTLDEGDWRYPSPGSIGYNFLRGVCR
jgi:hypothetical protein